MRGTAYAPEQSSINDLLLFIRGDDSLAAFQIVSCMGHLGEGCIAGLPGFHEFGVLHACGGGIAGCLRLPRCPKAAYEREKSDRRKIVCPQGPWPQNFRF